MTWSRRSTTFKATDVTPITGTAGAPFDVTVDGTGRMPRMEFMRALLYRRNPGEPLIVGNGLAGLPEGSFRGEVIALDVDHTNWRLVARFHLPDDVAGSYQLLVGWEDWPAKPAQAKRKGRYAVVDADPNDGLFRVT